MTAHLKKSNVDLASVAYGLGSRAGASGMLSVQGVDGKDDQGLGVEEVGEARTRISAEGGKDPSLAPRLETRWQLISISLPSGLFGSVALGPPHQQHHHC